MAEVSTWLVGTVPEYWVGAMDVMENDEMIWVANGGHVENALWMGGGPTHEGGNCAFLLVGAGLGTADCAPTHHMHKKPSLCRLI